MTIYYADSSALVKRHIQESGSNWITTTFNQKADNLIITSRISLTEVYSALNRRAREAKIIQSAYKDLVQDFEACCRDEYQLVEVTADIITKTRNLLERHPLRAYDALQLASALASNAFLLTLQPKELIFLSADTRLLQSAENEGIQTDNPNSHP